MSDQWVYVHFLTNISTVPIALSSVNRFFCFLKPAVFKRVFTFRRSLSHLVCMAVVVAVMVLAPLVFDVFFQPAFCCLCLEIHQPKCRNWVYLPYPVLSCLLTPWGVSASWFIATNKCFDLFVNYKVNTAYLTTHEIHLTKALFVIVVVFFASCVPSFLAIIPVRVILHSSCMPREMVLLFPYLMHVSSAINPWMYGDLSPLVRSKIKKVFFKRRVQLQDGEVTVLCTYQRKSKSPEENMIALESIFVISQNSD